MGISLVPIQDAIEAELARVLPDTPIYPDSPLDEVSLVRTAEGQLLPYITPQYGSIRRSPVGRSLASTRWDEYYSVVDVCCIAPEGRMARQMLDVAADTLIGFKPTGSGEMTIEGLPDNFVLVNNAGRPSAFVASVRFKFPVNTDDVGSHLTP
jgi:hypothetical protein